MDVSDGDAGNYDRGAVESGLDHGAVVAAAFAHGLLDGEAFLGREVKSVALESGRADDGAVEVPDHGAFFKGGLDGVGLGEGVVRRAALEGDGDGGLHFVDRDLAASLAYLLLGGEDSDHVEGKVEAVEPSEGLDEGGAADTAVEGLAEHQVVLLVIFELRGGHHGLAYPDVELLDRFLS